MADKRSRSYSGVIYFKKGADYETGAFSSKRKCLERVKREIATAKRPVRFYAIVTESVRYCGEFGTKTSETKTIEYHYGW